MNIFCELINNKLQIFIDRKSIQLDVHPSFYKLENDTKENLNFLKKSSEFIKTIRNEQSFLKRAADFIFGNNVFVRTDLKSERHTTDFYDFCKSNLSGRKIRIFCSQSISSHSLQNLHFEKAIDLIKKIKNKFRVNAVEINHRKTIQKRALLIVVLFSLILSSSYDLLPEQEPQLKHPSIFWPSFFCLLFFNGWIEYSKMKISFNIIFHGLFAATIFILLISRALIHNFINLLNLDARFIWTEFFLYALFFYLYNELLAVHFQTRNGQINK